MFSLLLPLESPPLRQVEKKNDGVKWSNKTTANWSMPILIHSESTGELSVDLSHADSPTFTDKDPSGVCPIYIASLFKNNLPDVIDLSTFQDLQTTLEGPWPFDTLGSQVYGLSNSAFTRSGDFVAEMCAYTEVSAPPTNMDRLEHNMAAAHAINTGTARRAENSRDQLRLNRTSNTSEATAVDSSTLTIPVN